MKARILICVTAVTGVLLVPSLRAQTTAYGIDRSDPTRSRLAAITLPDADVITTLGQTRSQILAGDFGPDDVFYAVTAESLVTVNLTNGAVTPVATLTGLPENHTVVGMSYDPVIRIMFLATTHLFHSGSRLHAVNLETGFVVQIGEITNTQYVLALAMSCAGDLYAIDGLKHVLVRVDAGSGVGKVIGTLDYDAGSPIQSVDFDFATGQLYWAVTTDTSRELRSIDIVTGESRRIRFWDAEFIAFAVQSACSATDVRAPEGPKPSEFALLQNYPNPFNPETTIPFVLNQTAHATLQVFNVRGEVVGTLVQARLPAGVHRVVWDGRDAAQRPVSSGVYFARLRVGASVQERKMLLVR